jgi:hypothetical protein
MNVEQVVKLVDVIGGHVVQLSTLFLTGYLVRHVSTNIFTYLERRLEVLGKDAYVLYPTSQYERAEDGRVVRKTQHLGEEVI